ncbi:hypothetical protein JKF63_02353 [Porcisia hertigi]|uniref:RanBP2-type domain-containing protein n=1 Tax=Porcisia hertigi TaxID=2761500 RepID=A0A836HLD7_9TRYP|nr:hypothetical protein JKF63_02353 [Porcisia hertigi]
MLKLRSLVPVKTPLALRCLLPVSCSTLRYAASAPGKWKCPCGLNNFDFHSECYSCHKKRADLPVEKPVSPLSLLGEVCMDDGDSADGFTCVTAEDKTRVLEGFWMCPACYTFNGAQRSSCIYCQERRPLVHTGSATGTRMGLHTRDAGKVAVNASPVSTGLHTAAVGSTGVISSTCSYETASSQPFKKGDWYCACGAHNFSRNTHCRKCSDPRAFSKSETSEKRSLGNHPGDWSCPECEMYNFSWRKVCKRCNRAQPVTDAESISAQTGTKAASEMSAGWVCPACHSINPAEDARMCVICGSPNGV